MNDELHTNFNATKNVASTEKKCFFLQKGTKMDSIYFDSVCTIDATKWKMNCIEMGTDINPSKIVKRKRFENIFIF